jgi:hypothetical protein
MGPRLLLPLLAVIVTANASGQAIEALTDAAPSRHRLVRRVNPAVPTCSVIAGVPAVAVSVDGGKSTLPHEEPTTGYNLAAHGVAVLSEPNQVLATFGRLLLRSSDRGCTWRHDAQLLPAELFRLVALPDLAAFAWSPLSGSLIRITSSFQVMALPTPRPLDLFVDPSRPNELAVSDATGASWWSDDGGATWTARPLAPGGSSLYAVEFSPADRRHAIAGTDGNGALVTYDGGATWESSAGTSGLSILRVAFSPVDSRNVWAIAVDPRLVATEERRMILHSRDSGHSFSVVLRGSPELRLTDTFTLAPHPTDPTALYFAVPGTTLVVLDRDGTIRQRSLLPYTDINAIAFHPSAPELLYLGLTRDE